jgi:Phage gp6-like head-tail connector protein
MATYDAVTLDEAKHALSIDGTAEDEMLQRLISATTLEVERRLGTQFVKRAVVEYHEGGGKRIYPQRVPITEVTSIVDPAAHTVPSSNYVIRQQRWLEHFGHFDNAYTTAGQQTDWVVTYVAGWSASTSVVAPDVKAEIIRAVAGMREAPASGTTSVSVGDLSLSYARSGGVADVESATSAAIDAAVAALHAYQGVLY